ncbi:MAG TPA: phosphoglucosamine mutase [Mycobacteriales bacterium]|nr:phosphoglucosamine mutase [Mycobacteriales bacterium]
MGLFGTDGVRGRANDDLTPELALALGSAAVRVLGAGRPRPRVVIGTDPRPSGPMLRDAFAAGATSAGADVIRLGVVPTALVAFAARDADLGVMVTASHNPAPDNGIKLFGRGGRKLTDAEESAVEVAIGTPWTRPTGGDVGVVAGCDGSDAEAYVADLLTVAPKGLDRLRIVVDCANGAASGTAPQVYEQAGAEVIAINAFAGAINDGCGATHLEPLRAAVRTHAAHVGIAHDGDADRCLAVDADGDVVDGDQILAILALALREQGRLTHDTVVSTVMANLGFHHAMRAHGITVVATPVGDRNVLEAMQAGGFVLGGEQSGHVIVLDEAPTGDGIRTALHLLAAVAGSGRPLAELAAVVQRLPQVLVNVRSSAPAKEVAGRAAVAAAVRAAEAALADRGRVLVRASGTEPLVRVMVEAPTDDEAERVAATIAAVVEGA